MNALEKYAAKKKLTDKMLIKLLGEKPGVMKLLQNIALYGGAGGLGGKAVGMGLDKGVNTLLSKGGKSGDIRNLLKSVTDPSKSPAGVGFFDSMGEGLGHTLGSIHGAKKWMKGRQAYEKKKMMAAAGASGVGGAGLGALLASAGKKKEASFWAGLKRMFGGNPYNPKTQPAQYAMAKGGNQSGEVMLPKPPKATTASGPDARTRGALKSHRISFR
tara:strand:+ start:67 stop:714 length:648 start_codon:yes stop_codon:yes gene_type:complete